MPFQAIAVFILYIRCTRINPADPGIMGKFEDALNDISNANFNLDLQKLNKPENFNNVGGGMLSSPSSTCSHSLDDFRKRVSVGDDRKIYLPVTHQRKSSLTCCNLGGLVCLIFAKDDCRKEEASEQNADAEDVLFCTLCNAEVELHDQYSYFYLFC